MAKTLLSNDEKQVIRFYQEHGFGEAVKPLLTRARQLARAYPQAVASGAVDSDWTEKRYALAEDIVEAASKLPQAHPIRQGLEKVDDYAGKVRVFVNSTAPLRAQSSSVAVEELRQEGFSRAKAYEIYRMAMESRDEGCDLEVAQTMLPTAHLDAIIYGPKVALYSLAVTREIARLSRTTLPARPQSRV